MSQSAHASVIDTVDAIADVVQRHGQHDFRTGTTGRFTRVATLCGLTVYFDGGKVRRIHAHDMDLRCEHETGTSPSFHIGSYTHLGKWYKQILQYDLFFCPSSSSAPPLAQAA